MAKRVMLQKEIVLLKKSKVLEDHPILKKFINASPSILDTDMEQLDEQERTFFRDIYPLVVISAAKEWKQDKTRPIEIVDTSKENRVCELCHHPRLKVVCYIVNTHSKESLQVGSECVKHFNMVDEVSINEQIARNKKLKNMEEINSRIHGIRQTVNSWRKYIDNLPILIPNSLRTPYQALGEKIEEQYEIFISLDPFNAHEKEKLIKSIKDHLQEANRIKKEISQYVESNHDNKFVPKRKFLDYLDSKRDITGSEWLQEDACITPRTFFRIDMKELMMDFRDEIQNVVELAGFRLSEIGEHGYDLEWQKNHRIHLLVGHSELMKKCGKDVLENRPSNGLKETMIIRMGIPRHDEGTYFEILNSLCNRMQNGVRYVDFDIEYNEAVFTANGFLYVAPLRETVRKYKNYALYVENINIEADEITRVSQKLSRKEYDQRITERQKAYTTQREFI